MGNAYVAVADDVFAIHYNPAGLGLMERKQFSSSYSRLFMGLDDGSNLGLSYLAYANPWKEGKGGTFGGSWQQLNLAGLYREQTLSLAYGRLMRQKFLGGRLFGGAGAKFLNRSLGSTPEGLNATDDFGSSTGLEDPVIKGGANVTAMDLDLGFLYLTQNDYALGLKISHLMQPNVGFKEAEKLPFGIHLGFGVNSLWLKTAVQVDMTEGPVTGSKDQRFTFAGEKWLPSLTLGSLGLRGSIGFGSRSYKQLTAGLSYRVNTIQFDYGFMMPFGTIEGTDGTHRFGVTFLFGEPTPLEQYGNIILERMAQVSGMKTKPLAIRGEMEGVKVEKYSEYLAQYQKHMDEGRFRPAGDALVKAFKENPADKQVEQRLRLLDLVVQVMPELKFDEKDKASQFVYHGILDFLDAKYEDAVKKVSYALSLKPGSYEIDELLRRMEKETAIKGERVPKGSVVNLVDVKLMEALVAFREGKYDQVVGLCQDVLELEAENTVALQRMGSALYGMKAYDKALDVWKQASRMEKDEKNVKVLEQFIQELERKLEGKEPSAEAEVERKKARVEPVKEEARPPEPALTAREIEKLYMKGVDLYVHRKLREAQEVFETILRTDSQNASARKALDRINRELKEAKP